MSTVSRVACVTLLVACSWACGVSHGNPGQAVTGAAGSSDFKLRPHVDGSQPELDAGAASADAVTDAMSPMLDAGSPVNPGKFTGIDPTRYLIRGRCRDGRR